MEVTDKFSQNSSISNTCQDTRDGNGELTTSCYKGKSWTFPVRDISKSDIKVLFNDKNYTNFTVTKDANGETVLTFADDITYSADTGDSNTSLYCCHQCLQNMLYHLQKLKLFHHLHLL